MWSDKWPQHQHYLIFLGGQWAIVMEQRHGSRDGCSGISG